MNLVTIGKLAGTHHLKGAMKVNFEIDNPEIIANEKVIVEDRNGIQKIFTIKNISRLVGNRWIIEFEEVKNKSDAGVLSGSSIKIRRELLGLAEDEYLLVDLIGMDVIDINTDENIGKVLEIMDSPAHDILIVEDEKFEAMIPNIEEFVKEINFDKKVISVDLIEGLREEKDNITSQDDGMEEE